jgi:hypothetical protein
MDDLIRHLLTTAGLARKHRPSDGFRSEQRGLDQHSRRTSFARKVEYSNLATILAEILTRVSADRTISSRKSIPAGRYVGHAQRQRAAATKP